MRNFFGTNLIMKMCHAKIDHSSACSEASRNPCGDCTGIYIYIYIQGDLNLPCDIATWNKLAG